MSMTSSSTDAGANSTISRHFEQVADAVEPALRWAAGSPGGACRLEPDLFRPAEAPGRHAAASGCRSRSGGTRSWTSGPSCGARSTCAWRPTTGCPRTTSFRSRCGTRRRRSCACTATAASFPTSARAMRLSAASAGRGRPGLRRPPGRAGIHHACGGAAAAGTKPRCRRTGNRGHPQLPPRHHGRVPARHDPGRPAVLGRLSARGLPGDPGAGRPRADRRRRAVGRLNDRPLSDRPGAADRAGHDRRLLLHVPGLDLLHLPLHLQLRARRDAMGGDAGDRGRVRAQAAADHRGHPRQDLSDRGHQASLSGSWPRSTSCSARPATSTATSSTARTPGTTAKTVPFLRRHWGRP